jgi:thioredoxin 2
VLPALGAVIEIRRSADFDRLIASASLPVVVDFWAPWCGPCRMVAPELERVAARQAGRIVIAKVNTDVLTDVSERFRIRSIPTMAIFAGGREIARTAGVRPAADIEAYVAQAVASARTLERETPA